MTLRQLRVVVVSAVALVLIASVGVFALLPARAADASAMSKKADPAGPFAGLEVTMAKTKNLINEVVEVSWKGGVPTVPDIGFRRNYLQIMQCWGDDAPVREQCQFGVSASSPNDGVATKTRRIGGSPLIPNDPHETNSTDEYVKFDPVNDDPVPGLFDSLTQYFDRLGTNEIPLGRTRADGAGKEFFQVQTAAEAPGLGCGTPVATNGKTQPRRCWLVVVPRGETETDGTVRDATFDPGTQFQRLDSSPLAMGNWRHRVQFPLEFQPVGVSCPLDGNQTALFGHEMLLEAVARWQPPLCAATGKVFEYGVATDLAARESLDDPDPPLAVMGQPPAATAGNPLVYAPLAVSALGIAFNMDTRTTSFDPPEIRERNGLRIEDLKLTPRLVAKLVTQSYRLATKDPCVHTPTNSACTDSTTILLKDSPIKNNPARIEEDEEFLQLNPAMREVNRAEVGSVFRIIVPIGQSDVLKLLWQWIAADNEARDFLAGTADPWGMKVNPAYQGLPLDRADIPMLDDACSPAKRSGTVNDFVDPLCPSDAYAYVGSLQEGVVAVSRGESRARTSWKKPNPATGSPGRYGTSSPQEPGRRGLMVLTEAAAGTRYGLPMAKLQLPNRKGEFVAPGTNNLLRAVQSMGPGPAPGTLAPNPNPQDAQAYPLTMVSYGVVAPTLLDNATRKVYADFLTYVAGAGQQAEVLPAGYLPLTAEMKKQTLAAAAAVAPSTDKPKTDKPKTDKPKTDKPKTDSKGTSKNKNNNQNTDQNQPTPPPNPANGDRDGGTPPAGGEPPAASGDTPLPGGGLPAASAPPATVSDPGLTPVASVGNDGKAVPFLLLVGVLAALGAWFAPRLLPARPRTSTNAGAQPPASVPAIPAPPPGTPERPRSP